MFIANLWDCFRLGNRGPVHLRELPNVKWPHNQRSWDSNPGSLVSESVLLSNTLCLPMHFPIRFRFRWIFHTIRDSYKTKWIGSFPSLEAFSSYRQAKNRVKIKSIDPWKNQFINEEEGGGDGSLLLTHPGIKRCLPWHLGTVGTGLETSHGSQLLT